MRPSPSVVIRPAARADREFLIDLLLTQLHEHGIRIRETALARAIDGVLDRPERGSLLVATRREAAVGVAYLSFTWALEHGGKAAWLEELYVVPDQREQGIGRALLAAACDHAARQGCAAVDLEVDAVHERAARLYAREGFSPLGRARWVRVLG
jgi:GNAT superfamily N-acetyltransferase